MSSTNSDHEPGGIPDELQELIQDYLDERLETEGFVRLQETLKKNPAARRLYLDATESAVILQDIAVEEESRAMVAAEKDPTRWSSFRWIPLASAAAVLIFALVQSQWFSKPAVGAELIAASGADWLSEEIMPGALITVGTQLQLASGSVEVAFASGATSRIHGPALFEIESKNQGFLHYGQAYSVADEDSSKGFTIRTGSSTYVDHGTEFITKAAADGYSQMLVLRGAVDANAEGFESRRIPRGSGIGFDNGEVPMMIQIERGSETEAFDFPSIPPPSSDDYASTYPVSIEIDSRGRPGNKPSIAPNSAPVSVLTNGRAQKNHDDPEESFFFREDTTGYLLFDLQKSVPVTSVQTYSWHRNRDKPESTMRAVQRFTLWGAKNERPAGFPDAENTSGWTRIARADTDIFFRVDQQANRPPQQACRILPSGDSLGEFRYLLFEVLPTSDDADIPPRHTFFSEIDIFTK